VKLEHERAIFGGITSNPPKKDPVGGTTPANAGGGTN
jgi:hypothetical protein